MSEQPNEKFPITVSLTRMSDGKTLELKDEWGFPGYVRDDDWENDPVFIWEEGNFSCDCNRGDMFARALGETEPHLPCGDGAFLLNWIRNDETGKVIFTR